MFKRFCRYLLCVLCLCLTFNRLAKAEDFELNSTPDDLYTYIQALYARNYDDTLLDKIALFQRQYPDHAYAEPIQQIQIFVLNRHQRHTETIEAIQRYLTKYPNSTQREAYRRLEGACRFSQKDYANSAQCFREIIDSSKSEANREEAMLALATCLHELKKTAEELKIYQTLVARPLTKDRLARLQARVQYINILQAEGNHQDALRLCQELLAFDATPPSLRPPLLFQTANLAFLQGEDFSMAEHLYANFLVEAPQNPNAPTALRQLCLCKFHLKKYEEFLELAQRYREKMPEVQDQQLDLDTVEALMALERCQEALPWLRRIIDAPQTPENVLQKARYNEFIALAKLAKDAEVLASGDAFLADYPNFPYKTAILQQLVISSNNDPNARQRTRTYLEALLPLLAGNHDAALQYGYLLVQLYETEQLWTLAADLLEKLARDEQEQRPTLLMRAAQNAALIPDFDRAKRLLDPLRNSSDLPQETRVQAAELLYQLATKAGKNDVAFQVARETLEKTAGYERTTWLSRLGYHFLEAKQYEQAANCYTQALAMPEFPAASRQRILPTQVQLLVVVKQPKELFELLPEFFEAHLSLRPQVCEDLASFCTENQKTDFARKAWELLLQQPELPADQRLRANIQLAELAMTAAPENARKRLQTLITEAETQDRPASADAYAILAELHLRAKEYDLTLMNVDRALEKDRPAVFDTRTATRAWWVKAKYLYDCRHDLNAAKSTASLAGILKTDEVYSPLALQLMIQILREQHQDKMADAEEERLKQKFPKFHAEKGNETTPK